MIAQMDGREFRFVWGFLGKVLVLCVSAMSGAEPQHQNKMEAFGEIFKSTAMI